MLFSFRAEKVLMRSIHQDINPALLTQWRMYFWHNSPAAVCRPLQVERGY